MSGPTTRAPPANRRIRGWDIRFRQFLQIHDEPVDRQKSGILVGSYERQFLAKLANDLGRLGETGNGGFLWVLGKHTELN